MVYVMVRGGGGGRVSVRIPINSCQGGGGGGTEAVCKHSGTYRE